MQPRTPPDPAFIRQVAEHHRTLLLARARETADDPRFVSGCTWSVRALDRLLLALDGETDPVKLGLVAGPEPASVVEQPDLFGALGPT